MLEKLPEFVGHALRDRRAGLEHCMSRELPATVAMGALTVGSTAFGDHSPLPAKYTADGDGTSPPLQWTGLPQGTTSVVLVVEDADSPTPHPLVHALVVDLPAHDGALEEGALDDVLKLAPPAHLGRNSYMATKWLPPDPPPGHGTHRYVFQVFALGAGEPLGEHAGRDKVQHAVRERAIACGSLVATYERPDGRVKADDTAPPVAAA